ncbi:protein of unknown function [Methanoculleus bourgensis]|uniref:Uncharacterized protein n=1 Tax=Methanoculleus bourgensis TaxID=83986 RepID=A0A0X8XY68_9EURY|nr:protein of unknown function [Methanoculleus bourgensis]
MVSCESVCEVFPPVMLQWSHVFSDMVRSSYRPTTSRWGSASMEPCLFRHGKGPTYQ